MATFEDTTGKVFSTHEEAAASNTALGTNPQAISSASLQPTKPYELPTTPTTPTTSTLALGTSGVTSSISAEATYTPPVNPNKDALSEMLKSVGGDIGNQASLENQYRDEAKLAEKKQKATAVSNQLDQMDKGYRDEVKAIRENPEGKSTRGIQAEVNDATDRYENNRANVALTYKVLAGDYNEAAQLVQDKIGSLERQNNQKIQVYQLAAQAVMNDLTESEKIQVQANVTAKQEAAKLVQTAYATALTNALQNGAPASVLSAIDEAARLPGATAASVLAAAGQYGVQKDLQFVSGTDNQVAGVFDKTTGKFTPTGGGNGNGNTVPSGTVGGYPAGSPEAKQYQTVLNTVLGSGKFTKDQAKAVTNAINNGEDPFTVIKNQAKTLLGQTGDTKLTSYEVAREQLTAVQNSLAQYYAAGGKTNIFAGNYEKVINKLGEVSDPKLVSIAVEIASSLQIYRNAVSGTAYSVQEGKDIASIFPGINKSEGLNTAILNGRTKAFDSTIDSTYRSVLGKSYDELKVLNNTQGSDAILPPEVDVTQEDEDIFNSVIGTASTTSGATPDYSVGNFFSNIWKGLTGQ